jgi:hypothetical protein
VEKPDELSASDAQAAFLAGVSKRMLQDAVYVCAIFQLMTRLADTLDFSVKGADGSKFLLRFGYRL